MIVTNIRVEFEGLEVGVVILVRVKAVRVLLEVWLLRIESRLVNLTLSLIILMILSLNCKRISRSRTILIARIEFEVWLLDLNIAYSVLELSRLVRNVELRLRAVVSKRRVQILPWRLVHLFLGFLLTQELRLRLANHIVCSCVLLPCLPL